MKNNINFRPKNQKFKKLFENKGGEYCTFTGLYAAESWLRENGFRCGSLDRGQYIAITRGEYNLPQKIHNLDKKDVDQMAGVIYSTNYREGTVEVWLYDDYKQQY